jgi:hypothetical protein
MSSDVRRTRLPLLILSLGLATAPLATEAQYIPYFGKNKVKFCWMYVLLGFNFSARS